MRRKFALCVAAAVQFGLFASVSNANAVDYSKCAKFVNNKEVSEENLKGYRIKESGPFVPQRLRYIPFDLLDNGAISIHEGASLTRVGRNEIVTYESPEIVALENLDTSIARPATRTVQVVIERDAPGHVTAIVENRGLVADVDQEIERIEEWNGDPELAFAYKETRTTFGVFGGKCVPMRSNEIIVRNKNGAKQRTEIVVFDTRLCHAIQVFFYDNREVTAAFDSRLNREMANLFATHGKTYFSPEDKGIEFLSNDKINELVDQQLSSRAPRYDFRMQFLTGFASDTQISSLRREQHGISPLISAHMIRAGCLYQRLGDFVYERSLWPDED